MSKTYRVKVKFLFFVFINFYIDEIIFIPEDDIFLKETGHPFTQASKRKEWEIHVMCVN